MKELGYHEGYQYAHAVPEAYIPQEYLPDALAGSAFYAPGPFGFEKEIAGYTRRHEVPPGLTGLAQIHGRYHTDADYKLGYDLQYLVNWSPVLDLQILARTFWVVLSRRL